MNYLDKINASADYIRKQTNHQPVIGMILGSGLGSMADQIENPDKIPYESIPDFPVSTVAGHSGQLVIGTLHGKTVIAMQGRVHLYEGVTMQELTFPVRVMQRARRTNHDYYQRLWWLESRLLCRWLDVYRRSPQLDGRQPTNR